MMPYKGKKKQREYIRKYMRGYRKKKKISVKPVKPVKPKIMPKTGRKTKLTPELQDKIIKRLIAGFYIKEACLSVGIGESTFYDWLKWGKEGREPFSEFSELTQQAEAEGEF